LGKGKRAQKVMEQHQEELQSAMMMMTTVEWPHFLPTNRGLMI
jgi:hypothetical protein